jgi:hypothetical protein
MLIYPLNMKKLNYHFFSVSLADNIPTLLSALNTFNRFYHSPIFSIICPQNELEIFQSAFLNYERVHIIPETQIINLNTFEEIVRQIADEYHCSISSKFRVKWYYQQILKLIFFLQHSKEISHLVMWDADTLPIANINFYDQNEACLYSSRLEFHNPYFETVSKIIPNLPADFFASTVQFFSANGLDAIYLLDCFKKCLAPLPNESFEIWVAKVVVTSICRSYSVLDASLFSEQELIGLACMCRIRRKQMPIMYLRWGFTGILSKSQIATVRLFGFKHVTYENVHLIRERSQPWGALLRMIVIEVVRQKIGYLWRGPLKDKYIKS